MSLNAKIQYEQVIMTISSLIIMSYLNERSKRWFITLNNYSNDDVEIIRSTMFKSLCKYYIFGFEHAPKTGTKHIHLYLRLNKNMYKNFKSVNKLSKGV